MLLDYELIGNLQVSNGIVSGFNNSTSNYIKIPYSLPMGSNKVEFCLSLYYPSLSSMSTILANYNDANTGGGLVLRSQSTSSYSNIKYWAWNSSGSMIAENIDTGFDLTVGTNVIKFVYENSTITWYKSTDGKNFTQGASRSGTIADFQNSIIIGASGTVWYSGNMQVNMLDSYIKVNDEYWHSKEYIKQKTKIIQRHDTAANWTSVNPVLAAGEMGVETDTNKFKFGDGSTAWSDLAYAAGEGGGSSGTTLTSTDGTTTYSKLALGDKLVVINPEIAWTNPQITSNSQDGYVASASVSSSSTGSAIWKAFNKDTTTGDDCWYTGSVSMPQWIMLKCPEPVRLTSCMIVNENKTPVNFKSGYIQGSNDGNTFDTLYTITDRPDTTGLKETYTFTNDVYYKYLRVYCTASHGSGLSIQEIEFSGFTKDATAVPTLNANIEEVTEQVATLASSVSTLESSVKNKSDKILNMADFYKIGSPTVSGSTYTSTSNNYLACNTSSLNMSQPYEIVVGLTTTGISGFSSGVSILGTNNGLDYQGLKIALNDAGYVIPYMSTNGTSWNYNSSASSLRLNSAGTYYIKFEKTPGSYYMYYSIDEGNTWTTSFSKTGFTGALINPGYFVLGGNNGDYLRNSNFNLLNFYIKQGNNYIISGTLSSVKPTLPATTSSLGVVQPDGTSITVSETGVISGQDVKTFTGYSDTGTLVLKSINGVLQWVAEG